MPTDRPTDPVATDLRSLAFAATTTGIVVTDPARPDHPIVEANPAFEEITGYARAEVLGRNCRFLQGPGTDPAAVRRIGEAIRDGREVREILLNYRKDGTPFWNDLRVTPVRDAAGRVIHFVGVQTDATDRVRAEGALRADAELLRGLVEAQAEIAALGPDRDAVMRRVAERAMRLTGAQGAGVAVLDGADVVYPVAIGVAHQTEGVPFPAEGSLSGLCLRTGLPQRTDDADADPRVDRTQTRAAGIRSLVVAPVHHDGRIVGALAASSPEPRAFGEREDHLLGLLAGLVGSALANAAAFAAVRAAEGHFRSLVENAPDAVAVFAADGTPCSATPAIERILGYPPAAFLAIPRFDLVHPDDLPGVLAAFAAVADAPGALARREYRARHADGSWRWLEAVAQNRLGDPAVAGVVVNIRDVTERRTLESALRDSEERYRSLVERLPAVVYLLANDPNQTPRYFSPRITDILGLPLDEAMTRTGSWRDRVHPDDRDLVAAESARQLAEGGPFRCEYRHRRRDGGYVWVRDECEAVRDADGRIVAWHGVLFDVTDQRRLRDELIGAREAAEAAAAQLDRFFALSLDPLVVAGLDGAFRRVNPAFGRVLGWSEEELLARPFLDLVHPDDLASSLTEVGRLAAGEQALAFENRYRRKDGAYRWLSWNAVADGDVIYAVARDVTAQKAAASELRATRDAAEAAERRLRETLDRVTDGFFALGPDWRFAYLNPAAERMLERRRDDLLGKGVWDEFAAAVDSEFFRAYRRAAAEGAPTTALDFYAPLGRWFEARAYPSAHGLSVFFQDVTERRRAEDELRLAKEAAEEASRLKGAFLSTMSHELRTPLNAIMGYAHLLLDGFAGDLAPAQADDVRQIAAGADRLLALVNDVLDLSRIGAGMLELDRQPTDLAAAVAAVAAEAAPLAAARGLALAASAPDGLVVSADPLRLHQILLNLVGNAVKFTEAGSVTIVARAAGEVVEVAVRDTGIGIDPEEAPHVFDEFRQADGSASRKHGGTGLGLAIVKRLVELHGGSVAVASRPGAGSTFTVTLPAAAAPAASPGRPS